MFLLYLARRAAVAVKSAPDVKTAVDDCIRLAEKLSSEASKSPMSVTFLPQTQPS
jgi:hypothetical protein